MSQVAMFTEVGPAHWEIETPYSQEFTQQLKQMFRGREELREQVRDGNGKFRCWAIHESMVPEVRDLAADFWEVESD